MFYRCSNLESVTLPNSLTHIGWSSFFSCSNLKTITLPTNLTYIQSGAFGSSGLETVYSLSKTPPSADGAFDIFYNHMTLYVPTESLSLYKEIMDWKDFEKIIGIDGSVGIKETMIEEVMPLYYFSIDGRRVERPIHGLYILRNNKGQSKIKIVK